MFMVDLIQWWYFRGWGMFVQDLKRKLGDAADFFSIGELLRTLFKPFRQISANSGETGMSAFLDKLISRFVGFFARIFLIIFGGLAMLLEAVFGGVLIVLWPLVPVLPVVCIVMTFTGVTL